MITSTSVNQHPITVTSKTQVALTALPPLALYVHFPWCIQKCPYCDFNSHQLNEPELPETLYLQVLQSDLESALPLIWGRSIHSVFIGGGTPSLLSARGLDQLLTMIRTHLPLRPDTEITLEANPGTFESEKFASFRQSGINRLSIGIQSFHPTHLQRLGRIHDAQQALHAVEIAQRHFDHFNLDLMFALPEQTLAQCQEDLEQALQFSPPHLSLYHLTLEANTLFAKFPPPLPDDELSADMQEWLIDRTAQAGFQHYEVSAYAQPGKQAQHNLNYWQFGDYLGIGAGAHSKLSFPNKIIRQVRYKHPKTYIEKAHAKQMIEQENAIDVQDLPFEFMLNALRLNQGFPLSLFVTTTGLSLKQIELILQEAEQRQLIHVDHVMLRPTALGKRFLNDLQCLFLKKPHVNGNPFITKKRHLPPITR